MQEKYFYKIAIVLLLFISCKNNESNSVDDNTLEYEANIPTEQNKLQKENSTIELNTSFTDIYLALRSYIPFFNEYKYRTLQITPNKSSVRIKNHQDVIYVRNGNLWKLKMFNLRHKHTLLKDTSFINFFYYLPIEKAKTYQLNLDSIFEREAGYESNVQLNKAINDFTSIEHIFFMHEKQILSVQQNVVVVEQNGHGYYGGASTSNNNSLRLYYPDSINDYLAYCDNCLLDKEYTAKNGIQILNNKENVECDNGVGVIRQRGQWIPRIRYHYSFHSSAFKDFTLKNPLDKSVVYNPELAISWKAIKEYKPKAVDAIFAPDKSFIIIFTSDSLFVQLFKDLTIGKEIANSPLHINESIVGFSWK